ncbi:glutamate-rich protein 6B isoform X2 [Talpa occidentalis]|uniref:glutamate-rich protein 6B isoform X2 n=1 Tax=Talpa occidentalis TaxID=50954 RepID=UPI00188FCF92|nr:glutamate-rich protein 6B isoform X2 [Talpa occidentalis]
MSANNNQSSEIAPSSSPTTSKHSTQTSTSEEEDAEVKLNEESKEEPQLPEEDQYLGLYEYLYEDSYAEEHTYLKKDEEKQHPEKEHLYEDLYSETTMSYSTQILFDEKSRETSYFMGLAHPFLETEEEKVFWRDRGTQTEWIYEGSRASESKKKQESPTVLLAHIQPDFEEHVKSEVPRENEYEMELVESISNEKIWNTMLYEPIEALESKDSDDNLNITYRTLFRNIIKEMYARNELDEDIVIPLTGQLESDTLKKLGILLKTNFEDYKEIILWLLKRRENLLKATENTLTYKLSNMSLPTEKTEEPETEDEKTPLQLQKNLEIETEVLENRPEVHDDDAKIILYPSKNVFQIIFADGSGQIHYPSGNLALLILSTKKREFTYIILEDSRKQNVRALIDNSGHVTFYDEDEEIWLSLSQNLGYYFPKGKFQKAWNWWNLSIHVHAPPFCSISLEINKYIKIQIRSQDNIKLCFTHQAQRIYLNLGTKYKFIPPEILSEMEKKTILEVEIDSRVQKIQVLLGKMSKILNILTISDLESFINVTGILLENDEFLRKGSNVSSTKWSKDFSSNRQMIRNKQSGAPVF